MIIPAPKVQAHGWTSADETASISFPNAPATRCHRLAVPFFDCLEWRWHSIQIRKTRASARLRTRHGGNTRPVGNRVFGAKGCVMQEHGCNAWAIARRLHMFSRFEFARPPEN